MLCEHVMLFSATCCSDRLFFFFGGGVPLFVCCLFAALTPRVLLACGMRQFRRRGSVAHVLWTILLRPSPFEDDGLPSASEMSDGSDDSGESGQREGHVVEGAGGEENHGPGYTNPADLKLRVPYAFVPPPAAPSQVDGAARPRPKPKPQSARKATVYGILPRATSSTTSVPRAPGTDFPSPLCARTLSYPYTRPA